MTSDEVAPNPTQKTFPGQRPIEVDVPLSALFVLGVLVVGTILLLRAIDRTQQLIALAAFAGILSVTIAPAVHLVQKVLGRVGAAIVLHVLVLIVVVGSTAAVVGQIRAESEALATFTDEQISEVDGWTRDFLERTQLDERLQERSAAWGTTAIVGDDDSSIVVRRISELLIVVVLSTFFTLQGGALVDVAMTGTKDRRRRRLLRARWTTGTAAAATFLRRNLLLGAASGLCAGAVAVAFGLPAAVLIACWAALLSMVPLLGTAIGWAPLVMVAAPTHSVETTVFIGIVCVIGIVATNVARARYLRVGVAPGSFVVAMGIAAGLTVAGLAGAAAGMFLVVALVTAIVVSADDGGEAQAESTAAPTESFGMQALEELTADHDQDGPDDNTTGPDGHLMLTLSRRTALRITAFVILAFVVQLAITRIGPIIVWATIGTLVAIGLDRPVSWIERHWRVQRSILVIVSAILAAGFVAALLSTAATSFDDGRPMDEGIPEFVAALEDLPFVGDRLADADLEARLEDAQRRAPQIVTRSPLAGQAVGLVGGGLVGAFWVTVAALTCLLDGPRLVRNIERRLPARIRRQSIRLARTGKDALGGYVAGAAVVAALNGTIVAVLGVAFGLPLVAILAFWAFSWNFIPQIGAIIGWAPLLLLAVLESPLTGLSCIAIFIVYQAVENNAIQPTIVGHAVDISALAALGAALVGGALAGLVGAALAIPIAGAARALYRETRRDDFPSITPRQRTPADSAPLP